MPLETTRVPILAQGGLSQQAEDLAAEPGGWLALENLRYDRAGVLRKRSGYTRLAGTDLYGNAVDDLKKTRGVYSYRGGLLVVAGDALPRYYASSPDGWVQQAEAAPCSAERTPILRTTKDSPDNVQHVRLAGWDVVTYITGGVIYLKQLDAASGVVVLEESPLVVDDCSRHRALAVGDQVVIVYEVGGEVKTFSYYPEDYSVATQGPTISISAATNPGAPWDAVTYTSDTWVLAWADEDGHVQVQRVTIGAKGAAASLTGHTLYDTPDTAVQVAAQIVGAQLWVAYGQPPDSKVSVVRFDPTTTPGGPAFLGNTVLDTTLTANGIFRLAISEDGWVLWDAVILSHRVVSAAHVSNSGVAGATRRAYWCGLYKRPFVYKDHPYVWLFDGTGAGYVLVRLDEEDLGDNASFVYEGAVCLDVAAGLPTVGLLEPLADCWPTTVDRTGWRLTVGVANGVGHPTSDRKGIDFVDLSFSRLSPALVPASELHHGLVGGGMMVPWYDGQTCVEVGFLRGPLIISATKGPGDIAAADPPNIYRYCAVYEWQDARGNWHYSAPGPSVSVSATGEDEPGIEVQFLVSCLPFTRKGYSRVYQHRNARIALFRTLANAPEVFYRLDNPNTANLLNNRGTATAAWTDNVTDAQVLANGYGRLYTTGKALEDHLAPPSRAQCVWQNRLWLASADDRRMVWYSKELIDGEAPRFNPELFVQVPDPVLALWPSGGSLILATAGKLYALSGLGPADTGYGADWRGPMVINEGVGCVDPRSVVDFPGGTVFRSEAGLQLLASAQALPEFIGAPVLQSVRTLPDTRAAIHDEARGRLLFHQSKNGVGAVCLVFDYLRKAWMTWTPAAGEHGAGALVGGLHVYADSNGILREGGVSDDGAYFGWRLLTPWLRMGGMLGYQRTRRVQIALDRHGATTHLVDLRCKLYTDDDAITTQQSRAWALEDLEPTDADRVVADLHVAIQKSRSFQLELTEEQHAGGGLKGKGGVALYGIEFEIGQKRGGWKIPEENRRLCPSESIPPPSSVRPSAAPLARSPAGATARPAARCPRGAPPTATTTTTTTPPTGPPPSTTRPRRRRSRASTATSTTRRCSRPRARPAPRWPSSRWPPGSRGRRPTPPRWPPAPGAVPPRWPLLSGKRWSSSRRGSSR